jgi:hypothetical protein
MMEAVRTSETSVDNHFTRQYNPEDSSEHHTRHRENLKSHEVGLHCGLKNVLLAVTAVHMIVLSRIKRLDVCLSILFWCSSFTGEPVSPFSFEHTVSAVDYITLKSPPAVKYILKPNWKLAPLFDFKTEMLSIYC